MDTTTFHGAHPTAREFYEQLLAWGFTRRRRDEGIHLVVRGPHGGRLRLLRSLTGRADAALVEKAARLVDTTLAGFWAGPPSADEPELQTSSEREGSEAHDSLVSLVLTAHVKASRPLGFEEVVDRCNGRVTWDQVRTASAALCRDGGLQRVRAGVYQWTDPAAASKSADSPALLQVAADQALTASTRHQPRQVMPPDTVELFRQLFPGGVNMTAETFADFHLWAS